MESSLGKVYLINRYGISTSKIITRHVPFVVVTISRGTSRVTITTNPEVNPESAVVLQLLQTQR
jgi:hypothetical protein